ncbi:MULTISPECIES: hypothetical protein [Nitratidesulfovibrio]|uniref:Uncharacterized protein n=1 Tax=Nitratidesulfovibrio liaohensis TaxID=2604158 RepID=A0ABY9R0Q3_9BACT|nr:MULTISPECIES: hypothetical protein [Nitratidesulfovibrio]WMW64334.1 hypothetical protein KPS_002345 [Nitratidesulfovibrio liaohensis]
MATQTARKPWGKMIVFGILSAALYAGVFAFADTIAAHFAQGSYWAAGPIATVFLFSYVHGEFTGSLWSVLGIEATRKTARKTETTTATVGQPATVRPAARRATLNA